MPDQSSSTLRDAISGVASELVALRRELHRIPEVGLDLPQTQRRLLAELEGLPLEITTGHGLSSIVAVLRGGADAPGERRCVLLRGDMDALPVPEATGLNFASTNGNMHACGHDLHMSLLVGAVKGLCAVRDQLPGDVVFMFQPGEEGVGGAKLMIEEGVLDAAGRRPDAAFAIHVFSSLAPYGTFCTRPGGIMAASDDLDAVVIGKGGHGSAPHLAQDPVPALADMVTQLQVYLSRHVDIFDPAVITVGRIAIGQARNVIPEQGEFNATVRTFSHERQQQLFTEIPELLHHVAETHGVRAEVSFGTCYPVTVNDADQTARVFDTCRELFGDERTEEWVQPLTGSEDFSFVLEEVPGTFIGLSAVPPGVDHTTSPYNHSAHAVFDDGVLADAALLLAELAVRTLR